MPTVIECTGLGCHPVNSLKIAAISSTAVVALATTLSGCASQSTAAKETITVTSSAPKTPARVVATLPNDDAIAEGIAIDPGRHELYTVMNLYRTGVDTLRVIPIDNPTASRDIPVGNAGLSTPTVDTATHTIYTADFIMNSVSVIDPAAGTVVANIPVPHRGPREIAMHAGSLYVSGDAGYIDVIDPGTRSVTASIALGHGPSAMAVDSDRSVLHVINHHDNTVSTVDMKSNTITSTVTVGYRSEKGDDPLVDIVVDPRTHLAYVSHGDDKSHSHSVSVIDPDTWTVSAIPVPSAQSHLALDPVSNTLFTGNYMDNTVSAIDLTTRTVTTTLGVGTGPGNIIFDPTTQRLYAANMHSNSISVIEPAH